MLYHPSAPPDLTTDDIDLIINNYVGTAIDGRGRICKDVVDILSCAKELFKNNASTAKYKYSFKLPIQTVAHQCDVPFRWNPDNENKISLDVKPTAFLAGKLFPLNDNTVRWLCSTHTNPIPTMSEALKSKFVLDYFDAPSFGMSRGKTVIEFATENRDSMLKPQFLAQQADLAEKAQKRQIIQAEQNRIYAEQQRSLETQRRAEQARKEAETKDAFAAHMLNYKGGLKGRRKQTKLKQTKRKEVKRKEVKRKQTKRRT